METIELITRARAHGKRTALIDEDGRVTYEELLTASRKCAARLLNGQADLGEARVACLVPPGRSYVIAQWGTWLAGGISVPLCLTHPKPEMDYVLQDAGVSTLIAHPDFEETAQKLDGPPTLLSTRDLDGDEAREFPELTPDRRAMIIYTSGTTGKPKGVVTTHGNIRAQIVSLVEAWEWSDEDHVLHVLPLHHVHGVINVLACALWAGAICEMLPRFDAARVWERFQDGGLTLFMAVPSVYQRLIKTWEESDAAVREKMSAACGAMRLMVCGSAALPVPVLEKWREISGHTLLERYGMTEIGMALSNPLHGERVPGAVGSALPGVETRLIAENSHPAAPGEPGEIEVRGPAVFKEYWQRPEETAKAFRDGWFRTGDIATEKSGVYRILGRSSVDIIKTGGYKVSALEIEQELLAHPEVEECAVVGVPDEEWGERVCAAIKWKREQSLESLRSWCKERLAVYKIPSRCLAVESLPRNAMGKVTKKQVHELFAS